MAHHLRRAAAILAGPISTLAVWLATPTAHAADGTWTHTASWNYWGAGANWLNNIVAVGPDATANFILDPSGDLNEKIETKYPSAIGNIVFSDTNTSTASSMTLVGNDANQVLTLDTTSGTAPTIAVNSFAAGKGAFIDAIIGGNDGFTKAGVGTLTLSKANTYTGPTTVSNGTLLVNGSGSLAAGSAVTVAAGGTLGGSGTVNGTITVSAGGILTGGGVKSVGTLTVANAGASALTLNGGTVACDLPASGTTCDRLAVTGNLVLNGANTLQLKLVGSSVAAGTYTVLTYAAKTGSGTITFPNGTTTMNNATLTVGATSMTVTVGAGGLSVDGTWTNTASWAYWHSSSWLNGIMAVGPDATAYFTLDPTSDLTEKIETLRPSSIGNIVFSDTDTSTAASITLTGADANQVLTLDTTSGTAPTITVNSFAAGKGAFIDAIIGGNDGFTKAGVGTLTLSKANTYTGSTTVTDGTLRLLGSGTLGSNTNWVAVNGSDAVLNLGGLSRSYAAVALVNGIITNGTLTGSSFALTNGTVSAVLAGVGAALTKEGAGTVTLTGANSYDGGTWVTAGRLTFSSAQSGGGGFTVSDGTSLGVVSDAETPTLAASSLTLGTSSGATLEFSFPNGQPAAPVITAANLTLNGTNSVRILDANLRVGQFPLIRYTALSGLPASLTTGTLALPHGITGTLVHNADNSSFDLKITAVPLVVTLDADPVPRYGRLQMTLNFGGSQSYSNPFNPDEVDLHARFTAPSGDVTTVNGFWDGAQWRLRFAAAETGQYSYVVTVIDAAQNAQASGTFTVVASAAHGWVRAAPGDSHYLAHDDGTAFYGVGFCKPWHVNTSLFPTMKSYGCNLFVYWLPVWDNYLVDPALGYDRYHMTNAANVDQIIAAAEANDVKMILTVWNHGFLREDNQPWGGGNWNLNPFNVLSTAAGFSTDATSWKYQQQYYRYLIARWGYSQSLAMWHTISEINGTLQTNDWHTKINNYFAQNDPFRHPTTGSRGDTANWSAGFNVMDAPQMHFYDGDVANSLATSTATMFTGYHKPNFVGEFGRTISNGEDSRTMWQHSGIWAALMSGAAITPLMWNDGGDWGNQTPAMYMQMNHFRNFTNTLNPPAQAFAKATVSQSLSDGRCWGLQGAAVTMAWLQDTTPGEVVTGATVAFNGLTNGLYCVQSYDTWNGSFSPPVKQTASNGILTVSVPPFTNDVAIRVLSFAATGQAGDSDSDSINDAWEIYYFGDLTTASATSDWDGDGISDLAEFLAGSNPQNLIKAATQTDLAAGASWTGGSAPGAGELAEWRASSLGAGLTLGTSAVWDGIRVTGALTDIAITGGGTLTLGASGIDLSVADKSLALENPLALATNQAWTVNAASSLTVLGSIGGSFGITKEGVGSLVLGGNNSYSGNTTVSGGTFELAASGGLKFVVTDATSNQITGIGTVRLAGAFTIDSSAVTLTTGSWTLLNAAALTESFGTTFTVGGFTPNGNGLTWTKTDCTRTWNFNETTGQLVLTVTPSNPAYTSWASGLANPAFDFDSDHDGLSNGLEWILGGDPSRNDTAAILPVATSDAATGLTLVFSRNPASLSETTLVVEWDSRLDIFAHSLTIGATDIGPSGNSPTVRVNTPNAGQVTITIPAANASSGKLFARLKATSPP